MMLDFHNKMFNQNQTNSQYNDFQFNETHFDSKTDYFLYDQIEALNLKANLSAKYHHIIKAKQYFFKTFEYKYLRILWNLTNELVEKKEQMALQAIQILEELHYFFPSEANLLWFVRNGILHVLFYLLQKICRPFCALVGKTIYVSNNQIMYNENAINNTIFHSQFQSKFSNQSQPISVKFRASKSRDSFVDKENW